MSAKGKKQGIRMDRQNEQDTKRIDGRSLPSRCFRTSVGPGRGDCSTSSKYLAARTVGGARDVPLPMSLKFNHFGVQRSASMFFTPSIPYPAHSVYPCLKSLLRVKRLYSSLGLPKLMSKPTSIPVAFR